MTMPRLWISMGRRAIPWLYGAALPIPVFVDLMGGGLARGLGRSGALPPLPISALVSIVAGGWLLLNLGQILVRGRRNAIAGSVLIYFGILSVMAVLAAMFSPERGVLSLQLVFPVVAFAFALLCVRDESMRNAFLRGLTAGAVAASIYVSVAVILDAPHVVVAGRVDPFDPPLPGMYQVGNYTPIGLIFVGALLLGMARLESQHKKLRARTAICLIVIGGVFFGSRDALLLMVGLGVLALGRWGRLRPMKAMAGMLTISVVGVFILSLSPLTDVEHEIRLDNVERLIEGSIQASRGELWEERGLDVVLEEPLVGRLMSPMNTQDNLERESSHNTYLEMIADFGVAGAFMVALFLTILLYLSISSIKDGLARPQNGRASAGYWMGGSILLCVVVSANVRLPFAQPYSALILLMTIGALIAVRRERA